MNSLIAPVAQDTHTSMGEIDNYFKSTLEDSFYGIDDSLVYNFGNSYTKYGTSYTRNGTSYTKNFYNTDSLILGDGFAFTTNFDPYSVHFDHDSILQNASIYHNPGLYETAENPNFYRDVYHDPAFYGDYNKTQFIEQDVTNDPYTQYTIPELGGLKGLDVIPVDDPHMLPIDGDDHTRHVDPNGFIDSLRTESGVNKAVKAQVLPQSNGKVEYVSTTMSPMSSVSTPILGGHVARGGHIGSVIPVNGTINNAAPLASGVKVVPKAAGKPVGKTSKSAAVKRVSTQDLALFNSLMDATNVTPLRGQNAMAGQMNEQSYANKEKPLYADLMYNQDMAVHGAGPNALKRKSLNHAVYDGFNGETGQQFFGNGTMKSPYYKMDAFSMEGYTKSLDSLLSCYSLDTHTVSTNASPNNSEMYALEHPANMHPNDKIQGRISLEGRDSVSSFSSNASQEVPQYSRLTRITREPAFQMEPSEATKAHFMEILRNVYAQEYVDGPSTYTLPPEVFLSSYIIDLGKKYDDSQLDVAPPEDHTVYTRVSGDKLKLTKQVLSSRAIASSANLNDGLMRFKNDDTGLCYSPTISWDWDGVHEVSWWNVDSNGDVRNFRTKFPPKAPGIKNGAFEEASAFAKFVENTVRPGNLIRWYPGFNIPIGTNGRANLRKVLHMDRMKNAELCDPVLEANGLKVAAKSTFGDMTIVELYKAAYVLGLWDVAAYNCLKTCKRRGYAFEWLHDIQRAGKRITLDALKYLRGVRESIEQQKNAKNNLHDKIRRRKTPDKRKRMSEV
ncbi:conserved hypothetical protein [Theileria equi strain WA]|uniref:Uncharacterized protein n=1 Tax=Theileria equi strain WA TaxID=1537102 RepID=L1LCA4_THEEQ|nr:conserved hypothetical protein [Theileria equi strain WA]EKX72773.1 conserved hypothetical protein [Theileria equi strain WA]|eukprot:XP_004832225.1 conserved hypothetical protein [Theileria equi strain WA]